MNTTTDPVGANSALLDYAIPFDLEIEAATRYVLAPVDDSDDVLEALGLVTP